MDRWDIDGDQAVADHDRDVIEIPYEPRAAFLPFHERFERWSVMVAHRRAGKTVACINELLKAALTCDKPEGRFAYIAPHYNQAKDVAWTYVKRFAGVVPDAEFNEAELRCDLPNGSRIRLYGADNPDRLRGIYLDGVILDEYADMKPSIWGEVVRPLLSDRRGWACWIGTPKGRNGFWQVFEQAQQSQGWFHLMLKASQTGLLAQEELDDARRSMTEEQYQQEFECSFEAAIQGAYYAKELKAAEDEGRIAGVPYDPSHQVHVAWDLGIGDATSLVFCQQIGKEWRIINFYESSGVGLDHYVKVLNSKQYNYGSMILPHDAAAKELGTGKSRVEVLESLGVRNITVLKASKVEDGINAVRMTMPMMWFDKDKCRGLLEALRQYRTEFDEKRKTFKPTPLHDWTSHAADAMRYLCVGLEHSKPQQWKPLDYGAWDKGFK